jgi:hypothetical protein
VKEPSAHTWVRLCRLDLMIPRLYEQGILVASKPTDEGCRRQHPKYPETVKSGKYTTGFLCVREAPKSLLLTQT